MSTNTPPTDIVHAIHETARRARTAAHHLATVDTDAKNAALEAMAVGLSQASRTIIEANTRDVDEGQSRGLSPALLDRLRLDEGRIGHCAQALRDVAALPDPVGQVVHGSVLPNALTLRRIRVPMGVVGMIYEARPNVTVDAAGLGIKSGNAVILRGGSAAERTNLAIVRALRDALGEVGLPPDAIQTIDSLGRDGARALMQARGLVDLLVPRGGGGLIQTVVREATVPVIETGVGNCHIYVDATAKLDEAVAIVLNSKTQRPGVCNAAETLLVHQDVADAFLPALLAALTEAGVTIHAGPGVERHAPPDARVVEATNEDWATEYLSLDLAVGVVASIEEAISHIRTHSTGHTEAICTSDLTAAHRFTAELDSAAIIVNASTRFTDGGVFGLGAEIGISTQKLHARGPMGLAELTTTKWIVWGSGQVRH